MKSGRLTVLLLIIPALLLAAWGAVALLLVLAGASPTVRDALLAAITTQGPVLIVWLLAVAGGTAYGLNRLYKSFLIGTARLETATRVLADDPVAPLVPEQGHAALQTLGKAINTLATNHRTLRQEMETRIAAASTAVAFQRDQLAALMAELQQGVIVCNLEGRILLYNAQASTLSARHGRSVGLGRAITSVFNPAIIDHAREALERNNANGKPSQFVTGFPDGGLLRISMAAVRHNSASAITPAPFQDSQQHVLTGFLLLIDDITHEHKAEAARDARMLAMAETGRASLASVQAALDVLDYPDLATDERIRFQRIVHDEVAAMCSRLEKLATDMSNDSKSRWPLQDMLGTDLLSAAAGRIKATLGLNVETESAPGLWLQVDSFALTATLVALTQMHNDLERVPIQWNRLIDKNSLKIKNLDHFSDSMKSGNDPGSGPVPAPTLRLRRAGRHAHLDLLWRDPVPDPAVGWQKAFIDIAGERLAFSPRDVAERHGGELWFGRQENAHERFVRFLLPLALEAPAAVPAGSRPIYYDFGLFSSRNTSHALDDTALSELRYTVFDTETTGLDPLGGDEIIQIGAVRIINNRILPAESFEQLIDPRRPISEASIPIHGIRPDMVRGKPAIDKVLPAFHAFAADTVLVGHNVAFDMRFLQLKEKTTGIRFEQPVLDTLLLASIIHPHEDAHSLEATAARLGIDISARHTAKGDAAATAAIFLKLLPLLARGGILTLEQARNACANSPYAKITY